jgi:hypothetical protein
VYSHNRSNTQHSTRWPCLSTSHSQAFIYLEDFVGGNLTGKGEKVIFKSKKENIPPTLVLKAETGIRKEKKEKNKIVI